VSDWVTGWVGLLVLLGDVDADLDDERAARVGAGAEEVERGGGVGEGEAVGDHALDGRELARLEERQRARVRVCVPGA
jgi:hypothetical protein